MLTRRRVLSVSRRARFCLTPERASPAVRERSVDAVHIIVGFPAGGGTDVIAQHPCDAAARALCLRRVLFGTAGCRSAYRSRIRHRTLRLATAL